MTLRLSKIILLCCIAFFFTLVVCNNITDYDSNYQFVHHVLAMDTTFPGNHGLWRHIDSLPIQKLFYLSIILTEILTAIWLWGGARLLFTKLRAPAADFQKAKSIAIAALTLACSLWLVGFLTIGGEWFLMWQSHTWNGQDAAFRMFTVCALILFFLATPEPAE